MNKFSLTNSNPGGGAFLNKELPNKTSKRCSFERGKGVFSFGFTLIELLAVIIILAVIALIATPIVLNVVEKAKDSSNLQTINGILDAGRLYYAESMLDSEKKLKIDNVSNIYPDISLMNKPENAKLYVNSNGLIATSVVLDKKCYIKKFNTEVEIVEDLSNCDLGFVGKDEIYPTLEFSYSEIIGINEWYTSDMWVTVTAKDNESGISELRWCITQSNTCEPITKVLPSEDNKTLTHGINITTESSTNNVCITVMDVVGNITKACSEKTIKLDKTNPSITGIEDKVVTIGTTVDLNEGITTNDVTSGINGAIIINPTIVNTSIAGTTNVEYSITDLAGNITTITRKIIVDANAPTVTFTPQGSTINSNGWSKQDFYVKVDLVDNSGLGIKEGKWCISQSNTCTPNAVISGTTLNPQISTESNNNRICIQATDNNNKQSTVICSDAYKLDKTIPVVGAINVTGTLGSNSWYTSNVNITTTNGSDSLSGHSTTITDINSITSNTTGQTITLTTTDLAGNTSTRTQTIKVDKTAPTLTAKSDTIEITEGDSVTTSTYFNNPSYSISGGSLSCNPTNTSSLAIGNQTITCTATGNNGLTATATKTITVKTKITYPSPLTTILKGQYSSSNTTGLLKDGDNYYYKGTNAQVANNFVWYEGHLWRVIQVNSDNTITMVTQQPITAIQPSTSAVWTTQAAYNSSYINTWLNNVFYNSISDKRKIKQSTFNVGIDNNVSEITTTQYVGLLDEVQYTRAGLNNSFLDIKDHFWLGNRYSSTAISYVSDFGKLSSNNPTFAFGARPVIKISDLTITSGNGTLNDPFRETKTSTNTSNVKVGEYISVPGSSSYCGSDARCLFRVVSKDSDSVKVILNGLLPTTSVFGSTTTFSNASTIYTPLTAFANSISTTYRYSGNKTFNIGRYGDGANYTATANTTYNGNAGLPVVGEIFSGNDIDLSTATTKTFVNGATIENSTISDYFWTMNANSSTVVRFVSIGGYLSARYPTLADGGRPVTYLNLGTNSNLTFTKGEGTAENPFWLGN